MTEVLAILARLAPAGRWLLAFLRSPLGQTLAVALIFGSLAWWHGEVRYGEGVKAERARWEARQAADATKARATEARQAQAGQVASQRVETIREVVRWRTNTIVKEIPYALPADPAVPGLRWGFVRLHDRAAVGVSDAAASAGEPDGGTSPITDARAIQVIAENYGACRFDQQRLAELQSLLKKWEMAQAEGDG